MFTDMTTAPPPPADRAFLDMAVARIRARYDEGTPPVITGMVQCDGAGGPYVKALEGDADDQRAKEEFANTLRYLSIRNASPRSALAYEAWIVESGEPSQMLKAQRMIRNGMSISRHPLAREMVFVNVESEAGRTCQRLEIRRGKTITLVATMDPAFMPRDDPDWMAVGTLADFHVPLSHRIRPSVIRWAAQMDRLAADVRTVDA
jgi:hypothetical protein